MKLQMLSFFVLAACDSGTGGRLTTVAMAVEVREPGLITLDDGATIELSRAALSFGPVYVFEQAPPTARRWWQRASDLFISSAFAHAGHDFFSGGRVMTEWITPVVLDLLVPRHDLGEVPAIAGRARSMSVHLLRNEANGGQTLSVSGTWRRGDVARPFSIAVELTGGFDDQRVDFVPLDWELDEGISAVMAVDPRAWFRGARFEEATLDPIDADSQTARAVQVNLRRFAAWTGRIEHHP
jgi:hypothetical protein